MNNEDYIQNTIQPPAKRRRIIPSFNITDPPIFNQFTQQVDGSYIQQDQLNSVPTSGIQSETPGVAIGIENSTITEGNGSPYNLNPLRLQDLCLIPFANDLNASPSNLNPIPRLWSNPYSSDECSSESGSSSPGRPPPGLPNFPQDFNFIPQEVNEGRYDVNRHEEAFHTGTQFHQPTQETQMGHHVGMLDGMDAVTGMFSNQAPAITSQDGYSNMLPAVTNPASELNNLDVSNPIPSSQQYQISLPEELHRNNSTATSFTSNDSDFLFSMDYLQNIVIDMQFQQHSQEGQIGQGHVMHRMADNIGLFGTQASVMTGQGGDGDMLSTTVDSTQSNATVTSNPILPTQQQQALAPGQPYGQQNHYNNSSTTSDNSFDSILPTNYAEYPAIMSVYSQEQRGLFQPVSAIVSQSNTTATVLDPTLDVQQSQPSNPIQQPAVSTIPVFTLPSHSTNVGNLSGMQFNQQFLNQVLPELDMQDQQQHGDLGSFPSTSSQQQGDVSLYSMPTGLTTDLDSIDDIVLTGSSEGRGDCCSSSSEDGNKSGTTLERDANCHSHTYNQGSETSQQFTCSVENCPKTFTRKKDLVHHVQNGHSKDTKRGLRFRCPIKECPVTLARERDVRRHMYFKHSIGKGHDRRFLCSAKDCHATFSRRYDLKRHDDAVHKNNTEGGRQFSCPVEKCNTVVSRAIDLHDHISTQHNQDTINSDRPFMCPICLEERRKHEGFTRWRDVLRHLTSAIHSSRNFTCPHCDKSFSRNDILSRHMRCCKKRPGNWTENDEEHESSDECN